MKATALLERHHRRVEQLVTAVTRERYVRRALLDNLAEDLSATLAMKEMIFYPAVREALGEPCESADPTTATAALQRCFDVSHDDAAFERALATLGAVVRDGFEREERELLPRVDGSMPPDELERLGAQMNRLYREIVEADGDERVSSIGRPSRADWYRFAAAPPQP